MIENKVYIPLRNRLFLDTEQKIDLSGLTDKEILEHILNCGLFPPYPQKVIRSLAEELLKKHLSFGSVLFTEDRILQATNGVSAQMVFNIKLFRTLILEILPGRIIMGSKLPNTNELIQYTRIKLSHNKKQSYRIIFLNNEGIIIDEEVSIGCIDASLIYPRNIIHKALSMGANAILMMHILYNMDAIPDPIQTQLAQKMHLITQFFDIEFKDYILIGLKNHFSFSENKLFN